MAVRFMYSDQIMISQQLMTIILLMKIQAEIVFVELPSNTDENSRQI